MKALFSLRRHGYLKTIGTLLIAVALIAGVVGCTPPATYDLTMAENPAGGGTATDETGTSPYTAGTVVAIKAVAADCYRFDSWTAPSGTLADPYAAVTNFTMPASDVTVTANFEPTPPDHFKFYWTNEGAPYIGEVVQLEDQFGTFNATVGYAISFGNPVEKVHADIPTPIADLTRHYTLYELDYGEEEPMLDSWQVMVNNQFQDDVELTVVGPYYLAVPTQKGDHEAPVCLDHLLVYDVMYEPFPEVGVQLKDQFIEEDVVVWEPVYFANPVQKTVGSEVTEIETDEHYVFYAIEDIGHESIGKTIQIDNQFGPQTLDLTYRDTLAVPSQKIDWGQPLDHFKCYWAEGPFMEVEVQLEDQFITDWLGEPLIAMVGEPYLFGNPVNKWHGDTYTPISNWNNHYTFYNIAYEEITPVWEVTVTNQFGIDQLLLVGGPFYLAVPTQKGPHDPPVGLDHFLVYDVLDYDYLYPDITVDLYDQFTDQYGADVYEPWYFANPVQKTHGSEVTPIKNDDHMVLYVTYGGDFIIPELPIVNQFGPQSLYVYEGEGNILAVPSVKTAFSIAPD